MLGVVVGRVDCSGRSTRGVTAVVSKKPALSSFPLLPGDYLSSLRSDDLTGACVDMERINRMIYAAIVNPSNSSGLSQFCRDASSPIRDLLAHETP